MFTTALRRMLVCGFACLALLAPLAAENPGIEAAAKGFQRLFVFDKTDGAFPGGIVQGIDGNFYGVAPTGRTNNNDAVCGQNVGCGVVFKVSAASGLTSIYNFCAQANCTDGAEPSSALALGADGLYGVTAAGGSTNVCFTGCGTIFRLTTSGKLTTLYTFCTQTGCPDGRDPSSIVLGIDGNFYGTTYLGGGSANCTNGCGTVFQLAPAGKLSTLYSFCSQANCADGSHPNPLIQANDGNLYGTTQGNGSNNGGTVFKLTTGRVLANLYAFCAQPSCADGAGPMAGLMQASNGDFYGTTAFGGSESEGTVFEITTSGDLTTIYTFCMQTNCPSGGDPEASLIQATDGNLYSTAVAGAGDCAIEVDCGTIFGMTTKGQFKTIYTFCTSDITCNDAREPGGLVQGTDGNFYGITAIGGETTVCVPYGCGSFYRVVTGFRPFVGFVNRAGAVGSQVGIMGEGLGSAGGVSFNGVAAQFVIRSNTYITATVPTGATTGTVTVMTANGKLESNMAFQVLPRAFA
jgi:uncharacterized repeat protein (TIGR03803 family)